MEGRVKERLTGALILIAALVIIVPEMLDRPGRAPPPEAGSEAGPPVRTYELQLDTPAAERTADQSALTPRSEPKPESAPEFAKESLSAEKPAEESGEEGSASAAPVAEAQVPSPQRQAPVSTDPARSASSTGQWWAQLGSFSARDNAERLARQLRSAGFGVSVSPSKVNGKELYRVRAGPAASREAAATLQSRLAAAGHKSSLVAP